MASFPNECYECYEYFSYFSEEGDAEMEGEKEDLNWWLIHLSISLPSDYFSRIFFHHIDIEKTILFLNKC